MEREGPSTESLNGMQIVRFLQGSFMRGWPVGGDLRPQTMRHPFRMRISEASGPGTLCRAGMRCPDGTKREKDRTMGK